MKNNDIIGIPVKNKFNKNLRSVSFLNLYSLLKISKSDISDSDIRKISFFIDGFFLCYIAKILIGGEFDRVSFDYTSIAKCVFDEVNRNKKRIVFVGSSDNIIKKFALFFEANYPDANIVLARNGFFVNSKEIEEFCGFVVKNKVDYVIIGMGAVNQEKIILDLLRFGYDGFSYTCGGFIDQTVNSGKKYYPDLVDKLNLRWAYRLLREPKRLLPRYFYHYPLALIFCILFRKKRIK